MMHCEEATTELKALYDGEVRGLAACGIRRHLRRCDACARHYERIAGLHDTLRSADLFTTTLVPARAIGRRPRAATAVLAAAALTAAIVAALILLPAGRPARVLAADVRQALGHVKTWHLSGWRMIHGRKVAWEIWGQRSPYLYYERNGDDVVTDNGRTRTYYFAAAPALGRAMPLVIIANSEQSARWMGRPNWERIMEGQGMAEALSDPFIKPERSDRNVTVFRRREPGVYLQGVNTNQILTVDTDTRLPREYELQYNRVHESWDTEHLEARYNVQIPKAVTAPSWPNDAESLDMRGDSTQPKNAAEANIGGIRVAASPQGVDSAGNIVVEVTGRFKGRRIPTMSEGWVSPYPVLMGTSSNEWKIDVPCVDGVGRVRTYAYIDAYGNTSGRPDGRFLLAPLEPLPLGMRPLSASHDVSINILTTVDGTDMVGYHGKPTLPNSRYITLMTQKCRLAVDLASAPHSEVDLPPLNTSTAGRRMAKDEIARVIYDSRALYLWGSMDYQSDLLPAKFRPEALQRNPPDVNGRLAAEYRAFWQSHSKQFEAAKSRQMLHACYWLEREISLMPTTTHVQRIVRLDKMNQVAVWYHQAARSDLARQAWRRVIREAAHLPEAADRVKEAQDALAGKQPSKG
jgi:hypothetical protein